MNRLAIILFPVVAFISFAVSPLSFAEDAAAPLKDRKEATVAVLSVNVYKVVFSAESLGAAMSMKEDVQKGSDEEAKKKAEEERKKESGEGEKKDEEVNEIDFAVLAKAAFDAHTKELADKRDWKMVSAADIGKPAALANFNKNLAEAIKSIPMGDMVNPLRWQSAAGLPYVPAMPMVGVGNEAYHKALSEAVKQYCEEAGVDGALILEVVPGYQTTGVSGFFSSVTAGSGRGAATASPAYVVFNKDGSVAAKPTVIKSYESEDGFWMAGGTAKLDKDMEKCLVQAMEESGKEVAERVDDDM